MFCPDGNLLLPSQLAIDKLEELLMTCKIIRGGENLIIDARDYIWGSPVGLAMLKSSIHSNHPCRIKDILWMENRRAKYLEKIDFFENINAPAIDLPLGAKRDRTSTLIELQRIPSDLHVEDISQKISTTLTKSLLREAPDTEIDDFDEAQIISPVRYLISELLLNSSTHAKRHNHNSSKAWVCAQALSSSKNSPAKIEVAIVDDGCGVLRTLADQLSDKNSSSEAIEHAMKPLVSCNFGVDFSGQETTNQGVGLYVAKDMIDRAGGRLQIISGDCIYDSSILQRKKKFRLLKSSWDGVAISITIPFDKIYGIKPSESLDKIGQAHHDGAVELNFQ